MVDPLYILCHPHPPAHLQRNETITHRIKATMPNTKTVHVDHLGGIDAAYQMPRPYDSSKPTLVLVNSFTTSSELYKSQYANEELNRAMNLISIELLGHGQTRTKSENFTYWDTACESV